MKTILAFIAIVVGVILLVALGGGVLILLSYGVGWLLARFLPFSPFEATALSLAGISIVAWVAVRLIVAFVPEPFNASTGDLDDEDEDDFDDDFDVDFDGDELEDEEPLPEPNTASYPGIPRWRQPIKPVDFSNVKPDDRCPCGSGRKYKNCHGRKANA